MNTEKNKKKDNIFVLILSLAVIAAVAAGVLAVVDCVTRGPREQAVLRSTIEAFEKLDAGFNNDPANNKIYAVSKDGEKWTLIDGDASTEGYGNNVVTFYPAKKDGKLVSIFGETISPIGYAGNITVLAAIKADGAVINVDVTQNQETPGLGTAVFSRETKKTIWGIAKGEYKNETNMLAPNPIMDFFRKKMFVPDDKYSQSDKDNPEIVPASKWKVQKDGGDFKYVTGATITSRAVTFGVKKILSVYYEVKEDILKKFGTDKD